LEGCGDKASGQVLSTMKEYEAKAIIATFAQGFDEPLCEAWEIFKALLRKCPSHGFEVEMQVQTFYNGL